MADVLVYRGWGPSGYGVFGHVLGSSYTYQISSVQPNWVNISNAFSSASGGFVFRGTDTNGSIDGLVFSDGTGSTNILVDLNGNAIGDPTAFSKFGNEFGVLGVHLQRIRVVSAEKLDDHQRQRCADPCRAVPGRILQGRWLDHLRQG